MPPAYELAIKAQRAAADETARSAARAIADRSRAVCSRPLPAMALELVRMTAGRIAVCTVHADAATLRGGLARAAFQSS